MQLVSITGANNQYVDKELENPHIGMQDIIQPRRKLTQPASH